MCPSFGPVGNPKGDQSPVYLKDPQSLAVHGLLVYTNFMACFIQGKGPGAGTGSSDGSGAGFGGAGGSGRVTMKTGSPYGDYTNPRMFGSGGGVANAGSGGGVLSLQIAEALIVEGM